MLRRLLALMAVLSLTLAAACSSDDGDTTNPTDIPTSAATEEPTAAETADPTEEASSDSGSSDELFASFNPFSALQGLSGTASGTAEVDPALKAALLAAGDVPPDFLSFGEFSFSVPDPDVGTVDMAARMFMSGDAATSGELGAMVMSMAANLPPGSEDFSDLDQLNDLSQEELDEISAGAEQFGFAFSDLHALDASGLGESGGAIHMEMDFGGMLEAFGAPQGENPFAAGIAMDMYMFTRGGRMLMLMVMYPADSSPVVDGHALAEIMDSRAS